MLKYKINFSNDIIVCERLSISNNGDATFVKDGNIVAYYPSKEINKIKLIPVEEPTTQELRKEKFKILLEKQSICDKIKEIKNESIKILRRIHRRIF